MEIRDQAVIVTGAGSGIGRALALEFGRQGARVACAGRREDRLRETVAAIEAAKGTALAVPTDVTDATQAERMVARVTGAFGRVDVIFNNAGSFGAIGPAWEVDPEAWWRDVTVNLRGTMLCCRAVLPGMLARDRGIVINMSGGNRISGGTGYSCSKVGVIRFTELLAKELKQRGSSVLAFVMDPGFVRTELTQFQLDSPEGKKWLPSSREMFERGADRPPGDCARATMELVHVACPALSGGTFDPDTDFEKARREAGK